VAKTISTVALQEKTMKGVEMSPRLILCAETAADLMVPNPVSIRAGATVKEAAAFLTDKGFSAAPVIDEAGRPVGVLSQSDIVVHDRECIPYVSGSPKCIRWDTSAT
jgi:CBS domain-containing protein